MDYQAYRKAFFVEPIPQLSHQIEDVFGLTLFFAEYEEAAAFYSKVLGSPQYVEGENTKGWELGRTWLTLLRAVDGNPRNAEIQLTMANEEEADELQAAFTEAGGIGEEPAEVLMYEPVRIYPISDPFGTDILLVVRK
jgi:hypothetical protein